MGGRRGGHRRNNHINSRKTHQQSNDSERGGGRPLVAPSAKDDDGRTPTSNAETSDQRRNAEHITNESLLVKWTKAVAYLTGGLVFVGTITAFIFRMATARYARPA
jgi:hypothetical protein